MNIFIHSIVTLAICEYFKADPMTALLAVVFGVLIDVDHIIPYIKHARGKEKLFVTGTYLRTFIQEPIFVMVVAAFSYSYGSYVPLYAWGAHVVLDYLTTNNNRPFSPFSSFEIKGPFGYGTIGYWVVAIAIAAAGIAYFAMNQRYEYLLGLI